MEHIYHKGKYRSGEWCKHLRPFLKRVGNKRWRKDERLFIKSGLEEDDLMPHRKILKKGKAKSIKIKFTMQSAGGFKHSYYAYYKSLKDAKNALNRNSIAYATVFERKGKIVKSV